MGRERDIYEEMMNKKRTRFKDIEKASAGRKYEVPYIRLEDLDGEEIEILEIHEATETRFNRRAVEMLINWRGKLRGVLTSAKVFTENSEQIRRNLPVEAQIRIKNGRVEVE